MTLTVHKQEVLKRQALKAKRFAAIAHYDAYLHNAAAFCHAILDHGGEVDFFTLDSRSVSVSLQQIEGARAIWPNLPRNPKASLPPSQLANPNFLAKYSGLFLGAGGHELLTSLKHIASALPILGSDRPILITGFPGIIDAGRTMGMLARCPSDIVLLPAQAQLRIYQREMFLLGQNRRNGLLYGIPSLPRPNITRTGHSPVQRILFVDQSAIPRSLDERRELVRLLSRLLDGYSEAELVVRERVSKGETSIHELEGGAKLSSLISELQPSLPSLKRVVFKQESLLELFSECDAVLSVSSTGLLEALSSGLPVASLKPFSNVPDYGNAFFRKSGLQVSVDDLVLHGWPKAKETWCKENLLSLEDHSKDGCGQERLVRRIQDLLSGPRGNLPNSTTHRWYVRKIANCRPHVMLQKLSQRLFRFP